jgi:hypothetical protein
MVVLKVSLCGISRRMPTAQHADHGLEDDDEDEIVLEDDDDEEVARTVEL